MEKTLDLEFDIGDLIGKNKKLSTELYLSVCEKYYVELLNNEIYRIQSKKCVDDEVNK